MPDQPAGGPTSVTARSIKQIEAGRCPCEGCSGTLTDPSKSPTGWGFCRRCRCAWKVVARGRTLYTDSIANSEGCPAGRRRIGLDAGKEEVRDGG